MIEPSTLLQNRYRVSKQIGQGGMGAVYVATDERFRSTVAVKQTFFDDPALRQAFEREAQLLNRLRHTALPRVSDHFTEGNGQFLVMEFIEGADVSELLHSRGGGLPVSDVLRWADELLDALDYLHTQDPAVIHRDIKPQNLKLTPRNQIILLDFGLAKGQSEHTRASEMASVFGYSRNYAPLEQIQGTGTDARSDIYSLAATIYHLITGQAPVDALTRVSAIVKNQPDPLRFAHQICPHVPAAVGGILHRAMTLNLAQRPRTAAEMRASLRQAAGGLIATNQPSAITGYTQEKSASTEVTVVDNLTESLEARHVASNSNVNQRDTTQLRHKSFSHVDATIVDATQIAPRRSNKIHVASSSFDSTAQAARKSHAKPLVAAAIVCLLPAPPSGSY
jgi:serine/threonine protein kinase